MLKEEQIKWPKSFRTRGGIFVFRNPGSYKLNTAKKSNHKMNPIEKPQQQQTPNNQKKTQSGLEIKFRLHNVLLFNLHPFSNRLFKNKASVFLSFFFPPLSGFAIKASPLPFALWAAFGLGEAAFCGQFSWEMDCKDGSILKVLSLRGFLVLKDSMPCRNIWMTKCPTNKNCADFLENNPVLNFGQRILIILKEILLNSME